jgi:hypothetical protein
MEEILGDYACHGKYRVSKANHKNIMLIGRTRTGKSTIRALLVDPTKVPEELTLKSDTRDPLFESFHASDNKMVLNIIDTPGLFERGSGEIDIRDNDTILRTISFCVNMEITKFHVICYCIAITNGINAEDIKSLELLIEHFGRNLADNSCLIITHCESKTEDQLELYKRELLQDQYFKNIASYFKLGIWFSGSLNRDDYNKGHENLKDQYVTICEYREKLIQLFTCGTVDPFPICQLVENQKTTTNDEMIRKQLETANKITEEQNMVIDELTDSKSRDQAEFKRLLDRYRELVIQGENAQKEAQNYKTRYEELLRDSQANTPENDSTKNANSN